MKEAVDFRRDEEIHFHTPGQRAAAFPYQVLAAGRATTLPREPPIRRRFNQHVLILTIAGTGQVEVGGQEFDCPAGSMAWLDTSGEYSHGCSPSSDAWTYLWLGVRGFGLDVVFDFTRARTNPIATLSSSERLIAGFEGVLERLGRRAPDIEPENSAAVANVVAALFAERLPGHETPERQYRSLDVVTQRIRSDLARTWRVADLSAMAGLSPSQLHRRFLDLVGATPMDWVRRERMNAAKRLLVESDEHIADVATRCGYSDPFHFSRDFRRVTGRSPTAFRHSQGS